MISNVKSCVINTEYGPVQGCKKTSVLGREYYNFQKIPYMKPPIGKLRFRDAEAPNNWVEPLDCTQQGPPFPNINFLTNEYEGDLDAMHINIYTNDINSKKPVMVWIHGGGVFTGNARTEMYGPDYFMQKDVLIVTFQYRMGAFGFLSLDDQELNIPGNAQFKDHIMALKWIKNNIGNFGGDSDNITLFGESWGGGSTNYHMISEKSKGLFHRGVMMSGTALNPVYSLIPKRKWAMRLCQELNYSGPMEDKYFLEFLENADPKEIIVASSKLLTDNEKYVENFAVPFGPTIESFDNGNIFLSNDILTMSRNCWGNEIDIMIGATSNEMSSLSLMSKMEDQLKKFTYFNRYVPKELGLEVDGEKCTEYGNMLKKTYYGLMEPTATNLTGLMEVNNDYILWHPASRIILSRNKSGKNGKTFVYRFDVDSDNNLLKRYMKIDESIREPTHGDDVCYLFKTSILPPPAIDSPGFTAIKLMLSVFTNFATNGNPRAPEIGNIEWEPASSNVSLSGININEKGCQSMILPEFERIKIFDSLFMEQEKPLY